MVSVLQKPSQNTILSETFHSFVVVSLHQSDKFWFSFNGLVSIVSLFVCLVSIVSVILFHYCI